ncbi:hypothetical protein VTK73DRAFT_3810 [Phialemonium thermophilum]|uniref:HORMA domain-containing protein n=1 Tax=Phialemonium thermophilum TaxID=223376 RepID=A0ABR3WX37_9PEZI
MSTPTPGSHPPSQPEHAGASLPMPEAHNLLTSFTTFLTVCIHNILYHRSIYPRQTFLSARAYNLPVHQNRHPRVCAWIRDAVNAVAAQMADGNVCRVAVVIHSNTAPRTRAEEQQQKQESSASDQSVPPQRGDSQPPPLPPPGAVLERWMFDVSRFPPWPGGADAMRDFGSAVAAGNRQQAEPEEDDGEAGEDVGDLEGSAGEAERHDAYGIQPTMPLGTAGGVNWTDVDQQLRGAVRRIASAAEKMAPLPEGCTFTVAIELREEGKAPIGHPQAWIPSEPNLQTASKTRPRQGSDVGGNNTIPVRSVEAGPLFFECWVEEGKAKEALHRRTEPSFATTI